MKGSSKLTFRTFHRISSSLVAYIIIVYSYVVTLVINTITHANVAMVYNYTVTTTL